MPFYSTSSQVGVDLNNPSSTALFGLNTKVYGTGDSEWQYVIATGTLTTGQFVQISQAGTAIAVTTAIRSAATTPLDIGVAQFTVPQGQYAFVAKRGQSLYVACTGTIPTTVGVGLSPSAGAIVTAGIVTAETMAGIFLEASASTATASIAQATLQWPRFVLVGTALQG